MACTYESNILTWNTSFQSKITYNEKIEFKRVVWIIKGASRLQSTQWVYKAFNSGYNQLELMGHPVCK